MTYRFFTLSCRTLGLLAALLQPACQLVVDFDRSRIVEDAGTDSATSEQGPSDMGPDDQGQDDGD